MRPKRPWECVMWPMPTFSVDYELILSITGQWTWNYCQTITSSLDRKSSWDFSGRSRFSCRVGRGGWLGSRLRDPPVPRTGVWPASRWITSTIPAGSGPGGADCVPRLRTSRRWTTASPRLARPVHVGTGSDGGSRWPPSTFEARQDSGHLLPRMARTAARHVRRGPASSLAATAARGTPGTRRPVGRRVV